MKTIKIILLLSICFSYFYCSTNRDYEKPKLKLWYSQPADNWNEALPIGNGRLGAMIFGDPLNEHLQLNENTLYSGEPGATFKDFTITDSYDKVVKMLRDGKYLEADKFVTKNWLGRLHQCYQPLGDLYLEVESKGEVTNFYRELDISDAAAKLSYQQDGINYTREVFASFPDQFLVTNLSASKYFPSRSIFTTLS